MNMSNPYGGYIPNYLGNYQQTQDERIWVQSEASAEAYLVAPNGFVRLWDSNKPVFYEKRADASGRPYPMEVYEYARKSLENSKVEESTSNELKEQIEALSKRIEALENAKKGGRVNAKQSDANDSSI